MHRAIRRWSFELGCRTRTRLDSNSCVDNGFFLRVLSLDTSSSTYFPLFQLALRPASTPDSNRRRSSISPPRNHVSFSLAKQVSFEHSISSPSLLLLREGKKNIQTNDRQMTRQKVSPQFVVDRSSARLDRDRGQLHCSAATSLATASTGTLLLPSQMSQIAGHAYHHQSVLLSLGITIAVSQVTPALLLKKRNENFKYTRGHNRNLQKMPSDGAECFYFAERRDW